MAQPATGWLTRKEPVNPGRFLLCQAELGVGVDWMLAVAGERLCQARMYID